MDSPIDKTPVSPTLTDPPPAAPEQRKVQYMRPPQKANYSHMGNNDEGYSNDVITSDLAQSYATVVCHLESMALTNYAKRFGNATNILSRYYIDINAMIEFNKPAYGYTSFIQHMLL